MYVTSNLNSTGIDDQMYSRDVCQEDIPLLKSTFEMTYIIVKKRMSFTEIKV